MTYSREEIEAKLQKLEASKDPKARKLAAEIREDLVEYDENEAADGEIEGLIANDTGTSFIVTSPEGYANFQQLLRDSVDAFKGLPDED